MDRLSGNACGFPSDCTGALKLKGTTMIKLVDNHTLFVEGAEDRLSAISLLEEDFCHTPVGAMFHSAGVFTLNISENKVLHVPHRKVRLTDYNVVVKNVRMEVDGVLLSGVSIGLPDDVVRLHSAWVAATAGMPYNWTTFLKDYQGDLEKIGSMMLSHVDTARIDGMMAQAITHPMVGDDEVGLSTTMMKRLHKALMNEHPELKDVETLDGMWVLLQGYPVVSPTTARWVLLRLIKGGASDKILVNAKTWMELHDRDEDGDGAYIGINTTAKFGDIKPDLQMPAVVMTKRDDLPDVLGGNLQGDKTADPVQTVMNMSARTLIGSQHQFFHGLARACAVAAERNGGKEAFDKAYRGVFKIYHPMAEGVFNKRKDEGGQPAFDALVTQMENHLVGKQVYASAFFPFLEDEKLQTKLVGALDMVSGSTRIARGTAFGRYLMAGASGTAEAFAAIASAMEDGEDMIATLQEDAMGNKIRPIAMPKPKSPPKKRQEMGLTVGKDINGLMDVFHNITHNSQAVLKVVEMNGLEDGTTEVKVRLIPVWKQGTACVPFTVLIPKISKVPSGEGHRFLNLPGLTTRMFCPIFRMEDDVLVQVDLKLWFAEMIAAGIVSFANRKMKSINQIKLQAHMDRCVRKAVRDLLTINTEIPEEGIRQALVRASEYRVHVNEGTISNKLAQYEEILTLLSHTGMDITTTSKNKPGTIVTKAWKGGIPRFIWSVNPFANLLDMKRKVEVREIRKALEFVNPIPAPIKTKGARIPDQFASVMTVLNVAIMDLPGWNVFEGSDGKFCFDTLLVTPSGIEKLKVKKLKFSAADGAERERLKWKLMGEGFSEEQIHIEEVTETLGNGLSTIGYDIVVTGEIEDIGKIKSAVGPVKGVMNPFPHQLFDENGIEIDLIVPHDTVVRKRAVDMLQYMMAVKNGITEVDPDNQPTLEVEKAKVTMDEGIDLGSAITGLLPFFRPTQTGRSTMDIRTGEYGVKVPYHAMIMAGGVDFHSTPNWVSGDMAEIVRTRKAVMSLKASMIETEETPMIEEYV